MKKSLFIFLIISNSIFASKNKHVEKIYDNITVHSWTYNYTEDVNKNLIIGQYAALLSKQLSYSGKILLYLSEEQYKETRISAYVNEESKDLNIYIISKDKDVSKCLNIIEYAIQQKNKLHNIKNEKLIQIYSNVSSKKVLEILKNKIFRPEIVKELEQSIGYYYFFQNQKYHIFRNKHSSEIEIYICDKILDFRVIDSDFLVLFVAPNEINIIKSRYAYNTETKKNDIIKEIKNQKIDNPENYYKPYKIYFLGKNKILFENFWSDRVMLFFAEKNLFIQDLDSYMSK